VGLLPAVLVPCIRVVGLRAGRGVEPTRWRVKGGQSSDSRLNSGFDTLQGREAFAAYQETRDESKSVSCSTASSATRRPLGGSPDANERRMAASVVLPLPFSP
jgi:hypothetical protein